VQNQTEADKEIKYTHKMLVDAKYNLRKLTSDFKKLDTTLTSNMTAAGEVMRDGVHQMVSD